MDKPIEVQRYSVSEGWIVADEGGRLVTYEAFRALEQRAEELAAECARINREAQSLSNQVIDCDRLRLAAQSQLREMTQRAEAAEAALGEEKSVNSKLREDRAGLARECNAFEAQLADLAKQKPYGYINPKADNTVQEFGWAGFVTPVFTRPAPAALPVDLVPDAMPAHVKGCGIDATAHWCDGYNACRAKVLRLIEGMK